MQLEQVFLNLILNAAEAIPKQGEIVLRCGPLNETPQELVLQPAEAADYVFLAVEDSGSGIAPELLPRIFEPFFTTKELSTQRGTGLGLYMVYEFAKEMGYGIMVESSVGNGWSI